MNELPVSAAAGRNAPPILAALQSRLSPTARVLEIGSGWGQHAVHFCTAMPQLSWLPSEQADALDGLGERVKRAELSGLQAPIELDVRSGPWPRGPFEAVYSANTAHIMSWPAVLDMVAGVARCLADGGRFFLYGPFNIGGRFTAPSNEAFDHSLRARNKYMGIRDLGQLEMAASDHHLILEERLAMPVNNFLLVFRCRCPGSKEP